MINFTFFTKELFQNDCLKVQMIANIDHTFRLCIRKNVNIKCIKYYSIYFFISVVYVFQAIQVIFLKVHFVSNFCKKLYFLPKSYNLNRYVHRHNTKFNTYTYFSALICNYIYISYY